MIYAPVFVEEFAPPEVKTLWVGLVQAAVPVGVMLGYIIAGSTDAYVSLAYPTGFYINTSRDTYCGSCRHLSTHFFRFHNILRPVLALFDFDSSVLTGAAEFCVDGSECQTH